jgi:uncharacterized protein
VRFDLPSPDPETRPFWDAAREHRLLIQRCEDCGSAIFYPRPFCPECWSEQVAWVEAAGRATLYTWSTVYRNDLPPFGARVPYGAAIVERHEGPRMMTNIVDCDHDELRIGMRLEAVFRDETEDITGPDFRPAA